MRVRLRAKNSPQKPPRVDRSGSGRINGLSLITKGEALGHDFWIDETTLDQVAEQAEGSKGRWTHGNLCADGLGTHLGRWENVKRLGDSVVGDFAFSPTAKNVKPEGLAVDAPAYLMDLAERDPDAAGVSTVLELADFDLEKLSEADKKAGKQPRRFARTKDTPRADFVGDPAANPEGLFAGTPSELSERATSALDEAAEKFGAERVRGFLASYLNGAAAMASLSAKPKEGTVDIETLKKQHADELAARDASIAALKSQVDALKVAEVERRKADVESYVASLKERAGKAQKPLAEADVAKVVRLFEGGHDEAARTVGEALAAKAEALGAGPFERKSEGGPLAPSGELEAKKAETAYVAAQLREARWEVELSADGTRITKKTPPKAGR